MKESREEWMSDSSASHWPQLVMHFSRELNSSAAQFDCNCTVADKTKQNKKKFRGRVSLCQHRQGKGKRPKTKHQKSMQVTKTAGISESRQESRAAVALELANRAQVFEEEVGRGERVDRGCRQVPSDRQQRRLRLRLA